jgi:hypothetical protein
MTSKKKAKIGCLFTDELDELLNKADTATTIIEYPFKGRILHAKLIPLATSLNRCRGICPHCGGDDYLNCAVCKDWKPAFGIAIKVRDGEWRKGVTCPGDCEGIKCVRKINGKKYGFMLTGGATGQLANVRRHIELFHNIKKGGNHETSNNSASATGGATATTTLQAGAEGSTPEDEEESDTDDSLMATMEDGDVTLKVEIMMLSSRIEGNETLKKEYDEVVYAPIRDAKGLIIEQTTNLIKQLVHDLKGAEEKLREATDVLKKTEMERGHVFRLLDAALEKDKAELAEKNAALDLSDLSQ